MAKKPHILDEIRKRITAVKTELDRLAEARLTVAETRSRINEWVDTEAQLVQRQAAIFASRAAIGASMLSADTLDDHKLRPASYLAWLDPEAMKARLSEALDIVADGACSSVPSGQRKATMATKRNELAELERTEEALIVEAERNGQEVARRRDVDPAIVLAVMDGETHADDEDSNDERTDND